MMLDSVEATGELRAAGAAAVFPARRDGDDVVVLEAPRRDAAPLARLHFLRQQTDRPGDPILALSDFLAEDGIDHIGVFACTGGLGTERLVERFEKDHDPYSSILVKAVADRLAEAAAEWLHREVRRKLWGYAAGESLDAAGLIAERYRGIRPAPGYPACPDHSEKEAIFALLGGGARIGMSLTDGHAMHPAASVSGYYFAREEAAWFGVGKIGKDQVQDYARRKGVPVESLERDLFSILGY